MSLWRRTLLGVLVGAVIGAGLVAISRNGSPNLMWDTSPGVIQQIGFEAPDRPTVDAANLKGPREWWHCVDALPAGDADASGSFESGCSRLAGTGITLTAPALAVGDRIELRRLDEARNISVRARTPAWLGPVTAVRKPALIGEARVGAEVRPRHGEWSGGWGNERSLAGVRACRTRAVTKCHLVTASAIQAGAPEQETLGAGYAGWFIGAIEVRRPGSLPTLDVDYPSAAANPIQGQQAPEPGLLVAVGPLVGPVR